MTEQLKRVCRAFRIEGEWASYEEISVGNINHTYKVNFIQKDGRPKSYIVQKVNTCLLPRTGRPFRISKEGNAL